MHTHTAVPVVLKLTFLQRLHTFMHESNKLAAVLISVLPLEMQGN
jgi:hypothetical protein